MKKLLKICNSKTPTEKVRNVGYIQASIRDKCPSEVGGVECLGSMGNVVELFGKDTTEPRLLVVAHGIDAQLVQEGKPDSYSRKMMDLNWWNRSQLIKVCHLLGCYTAAAVPTYEIERWAKSVLAYNDEVFFYDGHELGKKTTKKMVNAIVESWIKAESAADLKVELVKAFDDIAKNCNPHGRFRFFRRSREVARLMHLAIGLQIEGMKEANFE